MIDINNFMVMECQRCNMATVDIPNWVKLKDIPQGIILKNHVCVDKLTIVLKELEISLPRFEKIMAKNLQNLRQSLAA